MGGLLEASQSTSTDKLNVGATIRNSKTDQEGKGAVVYLAGPPWTVSKRGSGRWASPRGLFQQVGRAVGSETG